jgi:hypothetical protein
MWSNVCRIYPGVLHTMKQRIEIDPQQPLAVALLVFVFMVPSAAAQPYTPTDRYDVRKIEGWTVLVDKGFLDRQPKLAGRTLDLLRRQFDQVARRVHSGPLAKLRAIRIWVEENEPHHPCMTYHPDAGWLRDHGMNPEKARCVEVANARNFLDWTSDQPWMVLHELAHGYHHQFLEGGFDNPAVKAAFDNSIKAKRYESVERIHGKKQKAYAATDRMEYFAETSEAFFGKNDFFPFVRSELKRHDPAMFALLEKLWNDG